MTRVAVVGWLWVMVLVAPLSAASQARGDAVPPAVQTATEAEYRRLLEEDDAALEEIDGWIKEDESRPAQEGPLPGSTLKARVLERVRPVREAYDRFLKLHSDHAKAHLAYGSFLMEIGEEPDAVEHMEKARELEPSNPAAWNNLANHYGHRGPVKKAFEYYAKAMELNPREPTYLQNLATTVFLFRKDAQEHYGITETEVFNKALDYYRQALKLDPTNFVLASDLAQTYYGIKPPSTNSPAEKSAAQQRITDSAIEAWQAALRLAGDDVQRDGVRIHLARNQLLAGRYAEARQQLESVTNAVFAELKSRLSRNLDRQEKTNAAAASLEPDPAPVPAPAPTPVPSPAAR